MARAQIPKETWEAIFAERAAGTSVPELSVKYGISENTIKVRLKRERVQKGEGTEKKGKAQAKVVPFNVKHRKFALSIAAGKTQKQAAIDAGYSPSRAERTGSELRRLPDVDEAIQTAFNASAERIGLTDDYLAQSLKATIDKALADKPVLDKKGEPIGLYTFDGRTVVAAVKTAGEFKGIAAKAKEGDKDEGAVPLEELIK